uniref:NUMOD1 domain protein n=1 Tax=Pithovirus LCPAC401 TaxID=2506595 RepID=A0A481ZAG1_9VIRU|nr:MAG: NUMOD1 domain protein [Pithovirus LCPAC401]
METYLTVDVDNICNDKVKVDMTGVIIIKVNSVQKGKQILSVPTELPELELDERVCSKCEKIEEWKWLHECGYSRYMVSNLGRLLSISNNILSGTLTARGYHRFKLTNDEGVAKSKLIHTLMGYIFFNLSEGSNITMDHINQKKLDNRYCNLRPATNSDQVKNRTITAPRKGKRVFKIDMDGNIVDEYESIAHAAREVGVSNNTISRWCRIRKVVNKYTFRFFVESDIKEEQIWKSISELYPDIQPSLEISNCGWVRNIRSKYTKGSKEGNYLSVRVSNKETNKVINFLVHILVWTDSIIS